MSTKPEAIQEAISGQIAAVWKGPTLPAEVIQAVKAEVEEIVAEKSEKIIKRAVTAKQITAAVVRHFKAPKEAKGEPGDGSGRESGGGQHAQ